MAEYEDYFSSETYGEDDVENGGEQIASAVYLNEQLAQQNTAIENAGDNTKYQNLPPENPKLYDKWIDNSNPDAEVWKIWDGTQWKELGRIDLSLLTGSVVSEQIGLEAVDEQRLASLAVTAEKIAQKVITATHIAERTITALEIVAGTITANEIAARTITALEIVAGTITANEIKARTITANEIKAGTITANEILAGTITANLIAAAGLTADVIKGGKITSSQIDITTSAYIGDNLYMSYAYATRLNSKGLIFYDGPAYGDSVYDARIVSNYLVMDITNNNQIRVNTDWLNAANVDTVTLGSTSNGSAVIHLNGVTNVNRPSYFDYDINTPSARSYTVQTQTVATVAAKSKSTQAITFEFLSNGTLVATHLDGRYSTFVPSSDTF